VKLWSLQVVRFWAALAVTHLHATEATHRLTHDWGVIGPVGGLAGRAGVDVFFVLSGVIITLTSKGLTPGQFVVKRVRRIWPLYLMVSLPMVYLAGNWAWREVVANLLLWPATNILTTPTLGVAWSLSFEVLFYAAAALVIWRGWMAWGLLALFAWALTQRDTALTQFIGNPIIFEFLAGYLIAIAPRWGWGWPAILMGLTWLIGGAVLNLPPHGGATEFLRGDEAWIRLLTLGLPAALIVYGALQLQARQGALTQLGDASYALYLIHPTLVGAAVALLADRLPSDAVVAVAVAVTVVVSWRLHVLLEKPILAFLTPRPSGVPA
jgi:exopolysaccharide production protein ExoZ